MLTTTVYPTVCSPTRITFKLVFAETQGGERRQALETGRNRTCFGTMPTPTCGSTGCPRSRIFACRRTCHIHQFRLDRGESRSANRLVHTIDDFQHRHVGGYVHGTDVSTSRDRNVIRDSPTALTPRSPLRVGRSRTPGRCDTSRRT